jgi:hypothetical protein
MASYLMRQSSSETPPTAGSLPPAGPQDHPSTAVEIRGCIGGTYTVSEAANPSVAMHSMAYMGS